MFKLLKIFIVFVVFLSGVGLGYFYAVDESKKASLSMTNEVSELKKKCGSLDDEKMKEINLRLDLLSEYIGFVHLPKEKIDIDERISSMSQKVQDIDDGELSAKYQATGDSENAEQKILDFFLSSIEGIKNQLEKK